MIYPETKPDLGQLVHEYDPVERHAYYERTKKLKGRKKGRLTEAGRLATEALARSPRGKRPNPPPGSNRKAKAQSALRVAALQKQLHKLNAELKKREAELRSNAKESKKKPTAADKSKKAKDSEKYRDKHKQELKTKAKRAAAKSDKPALTGEAAKRKDVEKLKKTIDGLQVKLAAAVARQRALG